METTIQYLPAAALQPWSRNPKKHDKKAMLGSLERFGFTTPVLLDETTGRIIAGHGRVEAVLTLQAEGKPAPARVQVKNGEWLVPVVRGLSFATPAEAEAYLVADNRLTEIGGWDDEMLMSMLDDIQQSVGADAFMGTGFSAREVENLVRKMDVARDQGPTPKEKMDSFLNAQIKQIVLFFEAGVYDEIIDRMNEAMKVASVKSHTDLIVRMLGEFETAHGIHKTEEV